MSNDAFLSVFPSPLDDAFFRVGEQAAARARQNGVCPITAARVAIAHLRAQPIDERSHEKAVTAAAGEHRRRSP